jgi:hypothetical protein
MDFSTIIKSLPVAKDFVNILFFVIMGILGILSYRQAKKTIFTPLKTETFKLQLKIFEDILSFFEKHKKTKFIDSLDYRKILSLNFSILMNNYAETYLNLEIDKVELKKRLEQAPFSNMAFKHIDKFKEDDDQIQLDISFPNINCAEADEKRLEWSKVEYVAIRYTVNFNDNMKHLNRFIISPIIPSKIKLLIRNFEVKSFQNLHIMAEVLTEASRDLPQKYPTAESLSKADDAWIWNKYIGKSNKLEKIADSIFDKINNYLNIEQLLK